MSSSDRAPKRMKGEGGPMGSGPPPPDGYYGGPPPPGGRYAPYGGPPPPMGSGYNMWGQHPPPPHVWNHGSPTPPPPGPMYGRGGPAMTPSERSGYGAAYPPRGPPPPMPGPGGPRSRIAKSSGQPPPSSSSSRPSDKLSGGSSSVAPSSDNGPPGPPPPGSFPQGGYYPPPGAPYGGAPYPSSGPYGSAPYPSSAPPPGYGNSPTRDSSSSRPLSSPDMMTAFCQTTGTDNPDIDSLFSASRGGLDDDGTGSQSGDGRGGHSSKDKGRGSYKCGRCGVPKKGHVCPYQPKLTRRPGEPLPEMRSAAIQVEMDEFMTVRRLNLQIQGFPESYANEPYGEDMVIGEPHPPMSVGSPHSGPPEMMNIGDNGPPPTLPVHDSMNGVLGSPIRSTPMSEGDPISGAA